MKKTEDKAAVAASMVRAAVSPFIAFLALLAYVGTWLLLAVAVRRPLWWGLATGAGLLLLAALIIIGL